MIRTCSAFGAAPDAGAAPCAASAGWRWIEPAAPVPCWITCASSCASSRCPSGDAASYADGAKTMSVPAVKATAPRRCGAGLFGWTRTPEKSAPRRCSIVDRVPASSRVIRPADRELRLHQPAHRMVAKRWRPAIGQGPECVVALEGELVPEEPADRPVADASPVEGRRSRLGGVLD